jgi:hypothetical protein
MARAKAVDQRFRKVALVRQLVESTQHGLDRGAPRVEFGVAFLLLFGLDDPAEA